MNLTPQAIAEGLTYYIVLIFSISVHESAHAWTALRLGDDTAARLGRISLNPVVHIDPIGTLLIPMIQIFGGGIPLLAWAKPTPYNPANFDRRYTLARGHVSVAAAGPISNALLALVFTLILAVVVRVAPNTPPFLWAVLRNGLVLNVALAIFNLVPLPPLDGSKVASFGLPRALGDAYDRIIGPYGPWILLIAVASGVVGLVIGPIQRLVLGLLASVILG